MTRDELAEALGLATETELDSVVRAVARERSIRQGMAATGQGRQPVADMLDSLEAMDTEGVLDLTEGQPTTLADALRQYIDVMETRDELQPRARVMDELAAILAYPWSEEEKTVQLHDPHHGLSLHVLHPDDDHVEIRMGSNRWLVASGNYDELGRSGMAKMEEVAEAVYRATLARVIADRDHHVQLNSAETTDLIQWLARVPRGGSVWVSERLSLDAVQGGGVLVRTRPYGRQSIPRTRA